MEIVNSIYDRGKFKKLPKYIMETKYLPYYTKGEIVKGFGRGSKQLGIPTANFPDDVVKTLPKEIPTGVYYGFASIDNVCYKMVMSVGWNPFYNNEQKSMETHILHKFDRDLYGEILKVIMLGYLRPEKNFGNLDELIDAINTDIKEAESHLDKEEFASYKTHNFLID